MPIQQGNFRKIFGEDKLASLDLTMVKRMRRRMDKGRKLFRYVPMTSELVRHYIRTGFPMPHELKSEIQAVSTENVNEGPYSQFKPAEFGVALELSHNFRREQKGGMLEGFLHDMADAVSYHRALMPSEILNLAFSGKTYRDGKTLCATDHPLYGNKALQTSWSNRMSASTLTQGAIELAMTSGMAQVNEMGFLSQLNFKSLVVDRSNFFKANEILKSGTRSDTANRATNALQFAESGIPDVVMYDHLDPGVGFFLMVDPEDTYIFVMEREGPYRSSWYDERKRTQFYAMFYSRTHGVSDSRGVIGTPAS
jgi:hypothetical protein